MTVVCKKRSRLSGRPQASFGSLFTNVLAPAINAGASVLDSSLAKHSAEKEVNNNEPKVDVEGIKPNPVEKPLQFNQENVQSDPTKARLGARVGQRHKCWIGAAIGAATSIAGSLFGASAQKKQMRAQQRMQDYNNAIQEAQGMTQSFNGSTDAQEAYLKQFRTAARFGKRLGNSNIIITDGGDAQPVDNNTFLLRGGSHEDINETGQTGIGINVGGNQIEAEGGEVAQKKNGALRIFSAQPILGNGMSPAQAILRGYNKDKVFAAQQRFKRNNHLKDDGSKARKGGLFQKLYTVATGKQLGQSNYYKGSDGKYHPKRTKIKVNSDGSYRSGDFINQSNGKRIISQLPLQQVSPEFDVIAGIRGLNINTPQKPAMNLGLRNKAISNSAKYRRFVANRYSKGKNYSNEVLDKTYETALNKGQKDVVKDLRNSHFAKQANNAYVDDNGNPIQLYHTTNAENPDFHVFDTNIEGRPTGIYTTNDLNMSKSYNRKSRNNSKLTKRLYSGSNSINNGNLKVDANGKYWNNVQSALTNKILYPKLHGSNLDGSLTTRDIERAMFNTKDVDRVIIDNVKDYGGGLINDFKPNTVIINQNPSNLKYSNAITYDDNGNLIPLSQRDNFRNPDMRYRIGGRCKKANGGKVSKAKHVTVGSDGVLKYNSLFTLNNGQAGTMGLSDPLVQVLTLGKTTQLNNLIQATKAYNKIRNNKINIDKTYRDASDVYKEYGKFLYKFINPIFKYGGNVKQNINNMNNQIKSKYNCGGTARKRSRLGCASRPVKGMYGVARPKAWGGKEVKDKGGITPWTTSNHYNVQYPYAITDSTLTIPYVNSNNKDNYDYDYDFGNALGDKEVAITAKRITPTYLKPNNDALNLINTPKTEETKKEEVPYIPQTHNRSRTIFSGGDYLGLGIDTLAALSTGLVNYNTAGKYVLPDRAPIIQASKLPTTYNIAPEIEETKRYRDRLTGETFNNTSSSVAALNRSNAVNLNALSNLSKLWATKENEENKMLTEDAKNQQAVAIQNAQNELARQSEIARIKNEAIQAKGDALNVGLSGLSQAWTNFWTAGRTAYEDDQTRRAVIASSKDASPTKVVEMGYDLSPDLLVSLYQTSTDDETKRFYLSRLSPKDRIKYGIN